MSPDPIQNDVRKTRRLRILGPDAACGLCGQANPAALIRVNRSVLEVHHLAGEANDADLTVVLCRNCHAIHHEALRDLGVDLTRDDRPRMDLLAAVLRGLASFFALLGASLLAWADEVAAYVVAAASAERGN